MHTIQRLITPTMPRRGRRWPLSLLPLLALLLGVTVGVTAEEEFLLPDQAFQISGGTDGGEAVRVRWDIADGYYMYQSKFRLVSKTDGVEIGALDLPPAKTKQDEFFGEVQVYRNSVEILAPVVRQPGAENILTLEATSQGCADAGLCYPPHRQTVLLELPKLAAVATGRPEPRRASASCAGPPG